MMVVKRGGLANGNVVRVLRNKMKKGTIITMNVESVIMF